MGGNVKRRNVADGEAIKIPWIAEEFGINCCDCGLAHRVKIERSFLGRLFGGVTLRFWRDQGKTIANRNGRKNKYPMRSTEEVNC